MKNVKEPKQHSVFLPNIEKSYHGGFGVSGANSIEPLQIKEQSCPSNDNGNHTSRWNRYNYIKKNNDNEYLLFNCSTNNHLYMVREIKELLVDHMDSVERIESVHPHLYDYLKKKEFIVNGDFDEIQDAAIRIQNNLRSSDYFELFINPTLDCNLRCWYCYETLQKKSCVNEDTLNSIKRFIKHKVESEELKEITISFFGGEPLLKFNKVVWPIIEFTKELCAENKKRCYFVFTTNGVLLTRKVTDQLYDAGLSCVFQVPFDGNEEYHNQVKKNTNGQGVFNRTIHNVMYALSRGFKFTIRCNYTSENLHSFNELISLFNEYAGECVRYGLLTFSYHRVWQADQTAEMGKVVNEYENKTVLMDKSLDICYADRENSVVINYNGDVYNCTARDFRPEDREGYLNSDGTVTYNDRHHKRMEVRFSNKNCRKCKIFPICNVCSQTKLNRQNEDIQCYGSYSEEYKEALLLKKIEMVCNSIPE